MQPQPASQSVPPMTDPRVRPTSYTVVPACFDNLTFLDRHDYAITVTDGGSAFGWGVYWRHWCLNRDGEWVMKRTGSSLDDAWLAEHRFPRDEAIERALALVEGLRIQGQSAADFQAWYAAQEQS